MTYEDRQLVLKSLYPCIKHKVIVNGKNYDGQETTLYLTYDNLYYLEDGWWTECKPYLRSLKSLTNKERHELESKFNIAIENYDKDGLTNYLLCLFSNTIGAEWIEMPFTTLLELLDWFYEHHFDINGLIEKGLAIEINVHNNPYK
jgi:hypothetical protein